MTGNIQSMYCDRKYKEIHKYCDPAVKPGQPQQRDAGKGVRFRQAETSPGTVDGHLNIFGDLTYKAS